MATENYNFDLDKTTSFGSEDFIRILQDVARSVGIGYEQILDNISPDCEIISLGELVDIAKKVKEEIDTSFEEDVEIDEATADFIKLINESFYDGTEIYLW